MLDKFTKHGNKVACLYRSKWSSYDFYYILPQQLLDIKIIFN